MRTSTSHRTSFVGIPLRSVMEPAVVLAPALALAVASVGARKGTAVSSSNRGHNRRRRTAALPSIAVSRRLTFERVHLLVPWLSASPNPALNLAPFGRWTLRDKAAQRRLALRWASRT